MPITEAYYVDVWPSSRRMAAGAGQWDGPCGLGSGSPQRWMCLSRCEEGVTMQKCEGGDGAHNVGCQVKREASSVDEEQL